MADQITYDQAYDAVAPGDFAAMLDVPRYGRRTDAFDKIISATHDHFWDPLDKTYIDFDAPFDMTKVPILPLDAVVELKSAVADRLDEGQKIQLVNDVNHWSISNLLHGEQGALSLSASLCHILVDPGAQEYAANQAREEARHVTGFTKYIAKRWGAPLPVGKTIATVLGDLVSTPEVEDWAAQLFQMLLFNLINTEQKKDIYAKYGLDWEWVRDAIREVFGDEERRAALKESTNIFRVLIKTLLHAGIITSRTAPLYAVWVDMKELEAEGDGIPGDVVAEEMLVVLREINAKRRRISAAA